MTRLRCAVGVFWLAILGAVAAPAQTSLESAPLPVDPRVTIGTLDNGLRYYIRANERPENRAELRLVVNAGSILEDDDQRGLAHFVEHMAFNGTRHFAQQELVRYLESIGMRFGADLNASTGFDETIYMLTVPTDRADAIESGIQILADWADGVVFDPEEVEKERGVVIEEWRSRLGAQTRVAERQYPVLLGGSRYAERLPIGLLDVLQNFDRSSLVRFYETWYRPELMAVVAVGDFDVAAIESLIRDRFGGIPRSERPTERPAYPIPDHVETRFLSTSDPELTTTRVDVLHKGPTRPTETVGDYRRLLVERLYSAMFNSRLTEITQKPGAPFVAASAGSGGLVRTADAYTLAAIVPDGGAERGIEALLTEAERVARHGFTATELDRARINLLRALERAYAERERSNSGSYANEYVRHFLTGEPIPGIEWEYTAAQELLPGVTLDEVNALAREWLAEENRVVFVAGPEKQDVALLTEERLRAVLARVEAAEIPPYEDTVVDAPLLAELPTGSPVVEEIEHVAAGLTEWRLANGVRVLLKETDFRDDEIVMRAYSPGGLSLASDADYLSASFAVDIVLTGGVANFSETELRRVLAGKAAGVSPVIAETEQGFSGTASPKDLETLLQLVYLYFTAPRIDTEATEALLDQLGVALANRNASPTAAFSDTLRVVLSQGHPRSRPLTVERIGEIDPMVALDFYRQRFDDASSFTFAFVGNLDVDQLRPLVETYLGGLPMGDGAESWRDNGIRPPTGVVEKVVRRGIEPQARTNILFTGPFEYSRESAHALRTLASVLDVRLRERLREEMGGTYGASVSASVERIPTDSYSVGIGFAADPEQLETLTAAVFEEIEDLAATGPTEDELSRILEIQRRDRETNLRQNGYWIGQIIAYDREGLDFGEILTYERIIDAMTPERVRGAAVAYLRPDAYIRVSLYPETTGTGQAAR